MGLQRRIALQVIVAIFILMTTAVPQNSMVNRIECAVLDKSQPAQSISYEGLDQDASGATLRLRNNTNCAIVVETDDKYPTRLVRLPDGQMKVETITGSQDGIKLPLHYLVQERRGVKAPRPAYGWGDSVFIYEIPAGQSVIFIVPLAHFERGSDIAVPFNYSWEGSRSIGMAAGGVVHRVYFLGDDLPRRALGKKR
ncbi:MAG: hypothetical protein LC775_08620 [Acidobacteria bacterium]|nr:hypothetical protein [Acidobacteriota bacterium]